ncbi:hypothetical protein HDU98_007876, partial [Podochytrium sp. JEL0797]
MSFPEPDPTSRFLLAEKVGAPGPVPSHTSAKSTRWLKIAVCVSLATALASVAGVITMLSKPAKQDETSVSEPSVPATNLKNSTLKANFISTNAQCGANNGGASCSGTAWGNCCSAGGWCGSTSAYCGAGCQGGYGTCTGQGPPVTTDATCGSNNGGHTCLGGAFGNCCSSGGWCGSASAYCGNGCQAGFGTCTPQGPPVTTDATCGSNNGGHTCLGGAFGNCCSSGGWCGSTSAYCGTGCQSGFGTCPPPGPSGGNPPFIFYWRGTSGSLASFCQGSLYNVVTLPFFDPTSLVYGGSPFSPQDVASCHKQGVKVYMSVGGETGLWASAAANPSSLANAILSKYFNPSSGSYYGAAGDFTSALDGIDVDMEDPSRDISSSGLSQVFSYL